MRNAIFVAGLLALLSMSVATTQASAQNETTGKEPVLQDRGTITVSLTIADMVRISGADSVRLEAQHDAGESLLCIHKNANSTVRLRAAGRNHTSDFLARDGLQLKTYSVSLAGHQLQVGQSILMPEIDRHGNEKNPCGKGNSAQLTVQIHTGKTTLTQQTNGYADVLTLMIEST